MWRILSVRRLEKASCMRLSRNTSTSNILSKSHYDVLGLTPKATQSDIKSAYYRLSMLYHPDKNKGEDASSSFKDITAAYEVLGNYKLRKLYDKGLLHSPGVDASHVYESPEEKFYQSRASRYSTPEHSGKTPIYDFDEWARQHYGTSFAKRAAAKTRWENNKRDKINIRGDVQSEVIMFVIFTAISCYILMSYFSSDPYDVDRTKNVEPDKS